MASLPEDLSHDSSELGGNELTSVGLETSSPVPYCTSDVCDDEQYSDDDDEPDTVEQPSDASAAFVYSSKMWRRRDELKIYFLNPKMLENWCVDGAPMNVDNILAWAAEWNTQLVPDIPKFVKTDSASNADIRVLFNNGGCWSKIGTDARKVIKKEAATMNLSLKNLPPDFQRYLVIHEFGHALGLEHEHQRSDFWKVARKFLDLNKMKKDRRMRTVDFLIDIYEKSHSGDLSPYDPDSVMHYWFDVNWLKQKRYRKLENVEADNKLTAKEKEILTGIHKNSTYAHRPSETDLQFLQKCYTMRRDGSVINVREVNNLPARSSSGPSVLLQPYQGCECSELQFQFLQLLKNQLDCLLVIKSADQDLIDKVFRSAILDFITSFAESNSPDLDHLKEHLQLLHDKDRLITDSSTLKWALTTVDEIMPKPTESEISEKQSLFSKDTVYHASLCSLAVSTCTSTDCQRFFADSQSIQGHCLKEVSISQTPTDRFLIATQGDSTYYFAFQGNQDISQWPKKYSSFSEGISDQTENAPIPYIRDLLANKKNRIVLTGFCFGGLLASSVTTKIWDGPFVGSSSHLKENLVCITFAQPHLCVPQLDDIASESPEIASTIHSIYYEKDLIPLLVSLLDKRCSLLAKQDSSEPACLHMSACDESRSAFEDPVTRRLIQQLGTLVEPASTEDDRSTSRKQLKRTLSDLTSDRLRNSYSSSKHLKHYSLSTSDDSTPGLSFVEMTRQQALAATSRFKMEDIPKLSHEKHTMRVYVDKLARGYLEKEPSYTIPSLLELPSTLANLHPTVSSIEMRECGSKLELCLEGENLWFCYQLEISKQLVDIKPAASSATSIRVTINDGCCTGLSEQKDGNKVKITLCSRFQSTPQIMYPVLYKKEYALTARQRQIEKLSPSQLIELSFLSALLERHPLGHFSFKDPSQKMEVIREVVELTSRIVPLESIAHAISSDNEYVSKKCTEALLKSSQSIPLSSSIRDAIDCVQMKDADSVQKANYPTHSTQDDFSLASSESNRVVCGADVAFLYQSSFLGSPSDALSTARSQFYKLVTKDSTHPGSNVFTSNCTVLKLLTEIRQKELAMCVALLGAYMEQQKMKVQHGAVLKLQELTGERLLELRRKGEHIDPLQPKTLKDSAYAAEIEYSFKLETGVARLCKERNISENYPLDSLTSTWNDRFENTPLSLVAKTHHPLTARWLKWVLTMNGLRQKIGKTFPSAIGVVGLVNSGKTKLVNSLFGIRVSSGTTEEKRTAVPFIYNLKETVGDLDIVDFPGGDDIDDDISDLAELILTLAQVIIYVVDYRKSHCIASKKWLDVLQDKEVPVLVCLTHADKLYAEHMTVDGGYPDEVRMTNSFQTQLQSYRERLKLPPSLQVKFCTFSQDRDSVFNSPEGRSKLTNVGINCPKDVGDWVVDTFKKRLGLSELAGRLERFFIHSQTHD